MQGELGSIRNSPKGGARDGLRVVMLSDKRGGPSPIEGDDEGCSCLSLR